MGRISDPRDSESLASPRRPIRWAAGLGDADTRKCSWRIALDFLRSTCRTTKRRRIAIGVRRPTPDASDPCLAAPLRGDGHGRRDSGAESCENISETPTQFITHSRQSSIGFEHDLIACNHVLVLEYFRPCAGVQ